MLRRVKDRFGNVRWQDAATGRFVKTPVEKPTVYYEGAGKRKRVRGKWASEKQVTRELRRVSLTIKQRIENMLSQLGDDVSIFEEPRSGQIDARVTSTLPLLDIADVLQPLPGTWIRIGQTIGIPEAVADERRRKYMLGFEGYEIFYFSAFTSYMRLRTEVIPVIIGAVELIEENMIENGYQAIAEYTIDLAYSPRGIKPKREGQ